MAGKQAKVLRERQIKTALAYLEHTRYSDRNRVMFLLSAKAGLRAKEIAGVTWAMVTDSEGQLSDGIHLTDKASKGKGGGRLIYISKVLADALSKLPIPADLNETVIRSERNRAMSAASVTNWFSGLYNDLGFAGCSSHSGRRTFGTVAARRVVEAGGSPERCARVNGA